MLGGRKLLANTNFWQTRFEFKTEPEEPLVEFVTGGFIHAHAGVGIKAGAVTLQELPLVVMLGWYLIIMMHSDAAAAAVMIG